ncbi:TonB C-terminal domain-containing protein [Lysobacter sp. K5869]|uniref:cell envelope integrity protein TolA n=1 Tax=Lysobacter sp. K5869 TaxID=2820808 RepID=UPI001C0620C6|nr:TonB C-terminal domain-containing protein [Lysobacter sp. K5869]
MTETRADKVQALILVVLLHGLLIAALIVSALLNWNSAAVSAAGSPVATELAEMSDLSAAMQRTLRSKVEPIKQPQPEPVPEDSEPLPQPIAEPKPQDAVSPQQQSPQDFVPVPDTTSQEQVVDTPTPNPAEEKMVQEAKARQEQVDLTEQKRQEEAQQKQRLAEQQDAERQKKLEDIRRERARLQREQNLAEQKLQQLADRRATQASQTAATSAPAPAGNQGADTGLLARYQAALQSAIKAKWTRPDSVPLGAACKLNIRQLPGGQVIAVEVIEPCAYDEAGRRSVEAAVLKAQPLPYAGFESVFQRTLNLNFRAEDR